MKWIQHDGGRRAAGYRGHISDCAVRALCIILDLPYTPTYAGLLEVNAEAKRVCGKPPPGTRGVIGCYDHAVKLFLLRNEIPFAKQKCDVKTIRFDHLPMIGRLLVFQQGHITAVIDGVAYDTFNPTGNFVREYWTIER